MSYIPLKYKQTVWWSQIKNWIKTILIYCALNISIRNSLWNKNAFLASVQFRTHFYYKTLLTVGFLLVRRRKHGLYLTGIKAKISNKWRKLLIKNCHWNPAQGGSRGGALGGPSLPLILGKKKKRIAEGRKAGRASDKKPRPYFVTYRSTPFP